MLPKDFLNVLFRWLDEESESVILWISFSESRSDFPYEFSSLQFGYDCEAEHYKLWQLLQ